ncbi:MAG TPA: MATE family efflux transporter [Smithellaceae bacterium]|nr:MATE family efflux transporter [Smithellaceae bacterium]HRS89193.1 MATE family efflux transporter [Smithellaceae bacterium]HRV26117.1 MATE family efflux transporter [Smithellaceae bacterium]
MLTRIDLGKEAILPLIFKMSWPSIVAMMAMSIYNFIDSFWLARLSAQALAALTVCFPIQMIFAAIGVGTGVGAGSFSARMFGAGKDLEAGQTAGQIFFLSFIFGLGIILLVLLFHDQLLGLFGATEEILPLCRQYLVIISFSSPFLLFSMMSNNLLRAEGRPLLSMYVVLVASLTSAILDPFLIFGLWIFPQLGIKGAAFAAVIAQFIAFLFSVNFLCLKSSKYKLHRKYFALNPQIMRAIFSTGFPSIVSNFIISLVLIAYNHVLAQYGAAAIAALGICFRVNGLVTMILYGIGFGLMPIVGYSQGAGLYKRLRQAVSVAMKVSLGIAFFATIILMLFADSIVAVFSADPTLTTIAVPALRIYVLVLIFLAPLLVFINMFLGLGKGTLAMFIFIFRDTILLIPLLVVFSRVWGINGAWMAIPFSNLLAFALTYYYARREIRRFKSLEISLELFRPNYE